MRQALEGIFQIQYLADQRTDGKTDNHQQAAAGHNTAILNVQHLFQCAAQTNKHGADTAGAGQGFLLVQAQHLSEKCAAYTAAQNGKGIDNGSQSKHTNTSFYGIME